MEVRPLHKKVLVAQNKDEVKTEAGIILEDAASVRDSRTGTVLAIGPEVTLVEVGDKILLEWNKAQVVKIGEAQRVIVKEDDIVAVFDK
jgi:co-chaperonin GroES (HSP10)